MTGPAAPLLVAAGGVVGAPARFLLDRYVSDRVQLDFPLGTYLINVSGSFLLGLLAGLGIAGLLPTPVMALVGTGFCGAFTTFSTWSFETVRMVERGEHVQAVINVTASLVVGLLAAGLGIAIGLR